MRKAKKLLWGTQIRFGVMTLMMMLALGFAFVNFSFVSHADSKGKVTASSSVNIRKEASASSAAVGSADKDSTVDIRGKVTASDGTVWYQVFVDANTIGYIRSDLVEITDGTTPPTVEAATTTQTTTPTTTTATNETTVDVTAVEPLSATVTNGQKVRVRSNASTTSSIITSVQNGSALTVTGQAIGTDNKTWYQVEFISNGTSVVGFIRSDYVSLSGELVPVTETPQTSETTVPEESEESTETEIPEVTKTWETQLQGDKWYLLNLDTQKQTEIDGLFNAAEVNARLYDESQKTVSSQKIAIIILVILLIAVAAVAALLFLKLRDMTDSAYFEEVEKETARRRGDGRPQSDQKVVHTVGPDKKSASKPQGARTAGAQPQGNRPQGSKPAGARPQNTQQGNKTAGAKNVGAQPQGNRPQGTKPAGARPQSPQPQGNRPQATKPQATRPVESANTQQNPGWKSKNFMTDDDEFEFEFLNWDGDEE